MQRFRHFAANASALALFHTAVITFIALMWVLIDIRKGRWMVTVPVLMGVLAITYAIREFLVDNMVPVRRVMNAAALAFIVIGLILGQSDYAMPWWVRVVAMAAVGFYMGCFFWLLSDPRVMVEH